MAAALCGLATAVTGALVLFPQYGHVGIAAAIALSGWIGATLLAVILWRRGWLVIDGATWRRATRIVLATAVMGAAIAGGDALFTAAFDLAASPLARIVTLGVLVAAGLGVYLGALQALGVTSILDLLAAVRARL
jgi:putative peptidoglycan lipid II flippase